MYLQGGKLIFAPENTIIGRADQYGVVREIDGGMVVAQIDGNGNVIGPNGELLGRVLDYTCIHMCLLNIRIRR